MIKNWLFVRNSRTGNFAVFGESYGDYRFTDGHRILTSDVVSYQEIEGEEFIETINGSTYLLEGRSEKYSDILKDTSSEFGRILSNYGYEVAETEPERY